MVKMAIVLPFTIDKLYNMLYQSSNGVAPWRWLQVLAETCRSAVINIGEFSYCHTSSCVTIAGIYTILVSYNLIILVQQQVCFYRTTASVHLNSHKRTHAHTNTHTSKSSSALYRLFLYPTTHDTHATCFTCPSAPYSRILNIFMHIYIYIYISTILMPEPVCLPACLSIHPLWNFHAIFNTTLYPTLRFVNFVPLLFVMNYKLTRNAVYLSSVSQKEESKWRTQMQK
jgi:hypothetical protein